MKNQKTMSVLTALAIVIVVLFTPLYSIEIASAETADETSLGDVYSDGIVDMMDAMALYSHVSGMSTLNVVQLMVADLDGNGVVDMLDAMALYGAVAGVQALPTKPTTTTTTTNTTTTTITTTTNTSTTTETTVTGTSGTAPTTPGTRLYGIDVSYAQGTVDWQSVKSAGVDFAILRCGYGQDQTDQDDAQWERNAAECERLNIPYGAYFFCYARTVEEARGEAKHALRLLEGKDLTYPVFYDMEYSKWQGNLTSAQYAAIAKVFCDTLAAEGYKVGVYSNLDWWNNRLTDPCFDNWYRWVAQYNDTCDYKKPYHIWQYSEGVRVNGITGNTVDANYSYIDFRIVS